MIANKSHVVNTPRKKFDKYHDPDPAAVPSLWAELSGLASLVPEGERGGVHRLRTALLRSIPRYELPAFLDRLQEATA